MYSMYRIAQEGFPAISCGGIKKLVPLTEQSAEQLGLLKACAADPRFLSPVRLLKGVVYQLLPTMLELTG